jgi:hypothetical protein
MTILPLFLLSNGIQRGRCAKDGKVKALNGRRQGKAGGSAGKGPEDKARGRVEEKEEEEHNQWEMKRREEEEEVD